MSFHTKIKIQTLTYFHVTDLALMKHNITKHSNINSEVCCKTPVDIYARRSGSHRN
jgi:hypothetical protein